MRRQRITQQGIVFGILVLVYISSSLFLPGLLNAGNLIALLQNVAVLGILSLGTAILIVDRGIDLSMIATLAVPPGLVLQMVQNGHSVPEASAAAFVLAICLGFINGWLVAYAEVPSLVTTLASGLFLAALRQASFFQLDVLQWSEKRDPVAWIGRGAVPGVPMPIIMFALATLAVAAFQRRTQLGAYVYAIGDNRFGARTAGIPSRPVIGLQYLIAALIGAFAGRLLSTSLNRIEARVYDSTLIYAVILVCVLGGIGLSGGRGGVLSAVVGTLLIGTILNAMTIIAVSHSY
jgi:ribose transport system permease protein